MEKKKQPALEVNIPCTPQRQASTSLTPATAARTDFSGKFTSCKPRRAALFSPLDGASPAGAPMSQWLFLSLPGAKGTFICKWGTLLIEAWNARADHDFWQLEAVAVVLSATGSEPTWQNQPIRFENVPRSSWLVDLYALEPVKCLFLFFQEEEFSRMQQWWCLQIRRSAQDDSQSVGSWLLLHGGLLPSN